LKERKLDQMHFIGVNFKYNRNLHLLKLYLITSVLLVVFFSTTSVYAQNQSQTIYHSNIGDIDVLKTKNSERFVLPYDASNTDRKNPLIYTYDPPKGINWLLFLENNMTYSNSSEAKTIIKLMEPKPSEKFIELALFEKNSKFWVAVNTNESGYIRVHERDTDGWSTEQPITIGHANNQGLTVTNGKRIVIDKLSLDGFNLGSIAVYGKDDVNSPVNSIDGLISFNLLYGNPRDSPLYFLPIIMLVLVGGVILFLLKIKKRDKEKEDTIQ
jgi:hypothetical protein